MTTQSRLSRPFRVLLPTLVVVLLGLLGTRVFVDGQHSEDPTVRAAAAPRVVVPSSAPAHAPAAQVPPPKPLLLDDVKRPTRWAQLAAEGQFPKLEFTIDLDVFAPPGNGPANAAVWFRDFARSDGSRLAELKDTDREPVDLFGRRQQVYPADHPLLLEAEPWVDQATCRFYPEVWQPEGLKTPIANLMFTIDLAKSWTARGLQEQDPERAREDFRRAIRLGRLFMQEDFTLIQHLVGWACVSYGLSGLNEVAHREGDALMVAATTLALGDYNAMRSIVAQWMTEVRIPDALQSTWWGGRRAAFRDEQVERAMARARSDSLRCLRLEALFPLVVIQHEGARVQREKATAALSELAGDRDAVLASVAQWLERQPYERAEYLELQ